LKQLRLLLRCHADAAIRNGVLEPVARFDEPLLVSEQMPA